MAKIVISNRTARGGSVSPRLLRPKNVTLRSKLGGHSSQSVQRGGCADPPARGIVGGGGTTEGKRIHWRPIN